MTFRTFFLYFLPLLALPSLVSCDKGDGQGHTGRESTPIEVRYAANLAMADYGDYVRADFRNPWDTTKVLQTVLMVPREADLPADLPKGTVVRTPLQRSVVYTSVHNTLLDELGAIDAIAGVCDPQYMHAPSLCDRIADGTIADCGSSMAPNIEKILQLKPEAILLSAFENSNDHNKVGQLGVPIIDCIDYMEVSPLARAEWMRFFGRLYGRGAEADSLFEATEREYLRVKSLANNVTTRPIVLSELIYGQSWDVPAALSTAGVLVEDAGGRNPFDTYKKSGSVRLAPEEVLFKAKDADVWLIKYSQAAPPTLRQLGRDNEIYTKFRAYDRGEVYGCDVNNSTYFEDAAFHPHWILSEYVNLIHPEIEGVDGSRHYYKRLER